ncbi:hypothetical protein SEVIR_1G124133v4 [Setaria viridis]|uniref:Uncharacterized protein n=1 Tax=Setaria viridis TaxID=4556 RepID=A0A4U6W9C5_SETVI|nr:hypothetical protein SEVIR_1G124133v2 [Setaria viridis]
MSFSLPQCWLLSLNGECFLLASSLRVLVSKKCLMGWGKGKGAGMLDYNHAGYPGCCGPRIMLM